MDQLTEKKQLPSTRFGIEWMGSFVTARSSSVRRIDLLGIKGPNNYFTIFLPKKALQEPERNDEGTVCMYSLFVCVCVCVYVSSDPICPVIKQPCMDVEKNFALKAFFPIENTSCVAHFLLHHKVIGFSAGYYSTFALS